MPHISALSQGIRQTTNSNLRWHDFCGRSLRQTFILRISKMGHNSLNLGNASSIMCHAILLFIEMMCSKLHLYLLKTVEMFSDQLTLWNGIVKCIYNINSCIALIERLLEKAGWSTTINFLLSSSCHVGHCVRVWTKAIKECRRSCTHNISGCTDVWTDGQTDWCTYGEVQI